MKRITINIPRTGRTLSADRIKKSFMDLGWTLEMTGYLPTSTGKSTKVRTLVFSKG